MRPYIQYLFICLVMTYLSCKTQQSSAVEFDEPKISTEYSVVFKENAPLSYLMKEAERTNKLIFLDVYADWCAPCKMMDKEVFTDPKLGEYLNQHFINYKINGEKTNGPDYLSLYDIKVYPTLLFLDPNGRVLERKAGAAMVKEMMQMAESSVAKSTVANL